MNVFLGIGLPCAHKGTSVLCKHQTRILSMCLKEDYIHCSNSSCCWQCLPSCRSTLEAQFKSHGQVDDWRHLLEHPGGDSRMASCISRASSSSRQN